MFSEFDDHYTPKGLQDIVFQKNETRDLLELAISGEIGFPASGKNGLLLYGTHGSGKSALAKILPSLIEGARTGGEAVESIFEISQGGENGTKVIETIKTITNFQPVMGSYHYFVLDEVDNLLSASMSSLKVAMNSKNSIFILTTNNFPKVDRGVVDRCLRVEFNAASGVMWLPRVKQVLSAYGVQGKSDAALIAVINECKGSARDIMFATRMMVLEARKRAKAEICA